MRAIYLNLRYPFENTEVLYRPLHFKPGNPVRNHPEIIPQLVTRLKDYLAVHPDISYYNGKLFLVEAHRIRVRE